MSHPLEASLGILNIFAAHTAIDAVDDLRAAHRLAEKLPAQCVRSDRVIHFPSPLAAMFPELLFDTRFRENPDFAGHAVLVAAKARREVFDRTAMVGYLRGEAVVTYDTAETPDYTKVVVDWLNALPDVDPCMLDKLRRVTWQQAIDHGIRWHERLAARRADGIAGNAGTVDRLDVPVMSGWYWCHLITKRALDAEGAVMGHCVGSGYDYLTWPGGVMPDDGYHDEGIWSLRDETGRSRVTVEIRSDGIVQAHGPGNERPEAEACPAFEALIARFVKPGCPFDVPYWLVREEGGATHLRTEEEARADFMARREQLRGDFAGLVDGVPYGQVMFRPNGADSWADLGDVDAFRLNLQPTRRVRYARRGVSQIADVVTTSLEAEIPIRTMALRGVVEALSKVADVPIFVDGIPVELVPEEVEEIRYTAPAIARAPSRRERHEAGQPWYRQHERQRTGRAAR